MSLENKKTIIDDKENTEVQKSVAKPSVKAEVKNPAGNENKIRHTNSSQPRNSHDKKENKVRESRKNFERKPKTPSEFIEKVIWIRKINKVTTGGRRLRFSAAVAIGNGKGVVGFGISKANEVPDAIKKAIEAAHKNLTTITITKNNNSIVHEVKGKYCGSEILLKPAKEGIGIKAGGSARDILELAGIHNIYSKAFRSRNKINLARATIAGLGNVKPAEYFIKNKNLTTKRSNG
ncbi:30S ribosomal protein S5 [Spiroplasma endosymbiont of Aleiodes alternator]|uniref:30S ribosomal protein S5 n=1 Tax=Spiroplasma endosymbiont of Aleiodes alternator TaxID=3139329 RepID=UPI003CCB480D